MKRKLTALILVIGVITVTGCATVGGTAIGAGIGSLSGDTKTGALIGGGAGLMIDVFD